MNMTFRTRAAAAVLAVFVVGATPAFAQSVDVRVKVDTKAVQEVAREIREAVQAAIGPHVRRDIHLAVRDIVDAFEGLGDMDWTSGDWGQSQRFRATQTDRETRKFNIGTAGQVDLETLSGEITIRPSSGRELVVEIIRTSRGSSDATARTGLTNVRVESEERNGRVTVKTVYPHERRAEYSVSADYIVTAPAGTRISTRSVSGDVSVEGISGELSLHTISGDVSVTDAQRLTSAKTTSGDLTLRNVSAEGLLEASTISGAILATNIKARRLDLSTVSGGVIARSIEAGDVKLNSMSDDVVFEGSLTPRGRYEFSSHSGDVHIMLDGQVGFSFEGSTFSGGVRSDLDIRTTAVSTRRPTTRGRTDTKRLQGTFGDGSAVVSATSFSGSVIVTRK